MKSLNLKDASRITSKNVQVWTAGTPNTFWKRISRKDAVAMVKNNHAFVMSSQAIGLYGPDEINDFVDDTERQTRNQQRIKQFSNA